CSPVGCASAPTPSPSPPPTTAAPTSCTRSWLAAWSDMECGGLPPLWSAGACSRFGVGGGPGPDGLVTSGLSSDRRPPPTPKRRQAAALQSKLPHPQSTPKPHSSPPPRL